MTEQKTSQLPVRMPEERYEAIRKAAFESRRSMTDIVNEAVQQWLDQEKKKNG